MPVTNGSRGPPGGDAEHRDRRLLSARAAVGDVDAAFCDRSPGLSTWCRPVASGAPTSTKSVAPGSQGTLTSVRAAVEAGGHLDRHAIGRANTVRAGTPPIVQALVSDGGHRQAAAAQPQPPALDDAQRIERRSARRTLISDATALRQSWSAMTYVRSTDSGATCRPARGSSRDSRASCRARCAVRS